MAFGFSPKYQTEVELTDLTREHFLALGTAAAKKLGWSLGTITPHGFVAYTQFSMSSWSEEVKVQFEDTKVLLKSECSGSQLLDWGKNKRNIEAFLETLAELKKQSGDEVLNQNYAELQSSLTNDDDQQRNPYQEKGNFKNFFSLFIPTEGYFITPILINLNLAIFAVMVIAGVSALSPDGISLINWGANFRPVTLDGQPWRLFTCCFIHIGVFHLLMNMYALAYIGVLLEPQLGKLRFACAYILTGLVSSTVSLWWHDLTISAGASGAIFGLYGVFLSLLSTDLIEKSARKTLLTSVLIFVGYNLLNGFKAGIDNAAHLGGLLSGLVIGFIFIPGLKNAEELEQKFKAVFFTLVLIAGFILIAYKTIPNDIGEYDKRIKGFADYESVALYFYSLPENTPANEKIAELNDQGIVYWNRCIKLIEELDKLKLPDIIHQRDARLIEYCRLRIKSYEFIARSIQEHTNQYQPQIDSLTKNIEGIIESIKKND